MNNAVTVSGLECRRNFRSDFQYFRNRQWTFGKTFRKGLSFQVFENDILNAILITNIEKGAYIRV